MGDPPADDASETATRALPMTETPTNTNNASARYMRMMLRYLAVAILCLLCFACRRTADVVRPKDVPAGAVLVLGGKTDWWQQCTASGQGKPVHCRIWNQVGGVLEDEDFLPYDGGPTPKADELKIDPNPTFAGPDRIYLRNNRILLPKSRFEELKKFVDWLEGKAAQPH